MGLLKKLLGKDAETAAASPPPVIRPARAERDVRAPRRTDLEPSWVNCVGLQSVAGESYHQAGIRQCADHGREQVAVLQCEPTNAYDSNAVQVFIGTHLVGYVPGDLAASYAPAIAQLEAAGVAPQCHALITGGRGEKSSYGVRLNLAGPDVLALSCTPPAQPLPPGRVVTITREEHYQHTLRAAYNRHGPTVFATLDLVQRDPHMKKDSGPVIRASIDGAPIGYMTANKSSEYGYLVRQMIDRGETPCVFTFLDPSVKNEQEVVEALVHLPFLDRAP